MNRKKLLDKITTEAKNKTIQGAANKIGVNYVTLWRVIKGKSMGSIVFWETVDAHYYPRRAK